MSNADCMDYQKCGMKQTDLIDYDTEKYTKSTHVFTNVKVKQLLRLRNPYEFK